MCAISSETFLRRELGDGNCILTSMLPQDLILTNAQFDAHWNGRPAERHKILMYGKLIETPRWQQALGIDYAYSGSKNNALPIPDWLLPILAWSVVTIFRNLNGILNNYYEGPEDYIGPHHDSLKGLIPGSPIVTISFGEERIFRLEKGEGDSRRIVDLPALHGTVFVMPWATNKAWKHSVPKKARYTGRRISVTIRAFTEDLVRSADSSEHLVRSD